VDSGRPNHLGSAYRIVSAIRERETGSSTATTSIAADRREDGARRALSSIARVQTLRRTPLYQQHVAAGARMVPFAGWELPVQYEGVLAEHRAVRTDAGVFDVSHMGELEVEGPTAHELLQARLSNDVSALSRGEA